MALYPNGQIPQSALDPFPAVIGGTAYLFPAVAASLHRVRARAAKIGFDLRITSSGDGFRSYQRQRNVFQERYQRNGDPNFRGPFGDVRWWDSDNSGVKERWVRVRGAAAAVPGTSNHGKGITADISGLGPYNGHWWPRIAPLLIAEGWSNAEGRPIKEPWHWNYTRSAYLVTDTNNIPDVDIKVPGDINLPDPLEEDDMFTDDDREALTALRNLLSIKGAPYGYPQATLAAVTDLSEAVKGLDTDNRWLADQVMVPGAPYTYFAALLSAARETQAEVAALRSALDSKVIAAGGDPVAFRAEIDKALDDFKASLEVTVAPKQA